MKAKLKPCDGDVCGGALKVIWKNHGGKRYCQGCWKLELPKLGEKHKPTPKQKPLSPRSPKRAKEERIYSGKRIIFLRENPMCQAHLQGCSQKATEVHHKAGRVGSLYLDTSYWLATCRTCHTWIEAHPVEARESGFSLTKHSNEKNDEEKYKEEDPPLL